MFTKAPPSKPLLHVASPPAARAYPRTPQRTSTVTSAQFTSTSVTPSALHMTSTSVAPQSAQRSVAPSPLAVYGITATPMHRPRRDGRLFERGQPTVDLSRHQLHDADCATLVQTLFDESDSAVQSLYLQRNCIGDAGAQAIACAVSLVPQLLPALDLTSVPVTVASTPVSKNISITPSVVPLKTHSNTSSALPSAVGSKSAIEPSPKPSNSVASPSAPSPLKSASSLSTREPALPTSEVTPVIAPPVTAVTPVGIASDTISRTSTHRNSQSVTPIVDISQAGSVRQDSCQDALTSPALMDNVVPPLNIPFSPSSTINRVVPASPGLNQNLYPVFVPPAGRVCTVAHSLTRLSMHSNQIGAGGAALIGAALVNNRSLLSLDLLFNPDIGPQGVASIASALPLNGTLTHLGLSWTSAGADGAEALAQALKHANRQSLRSLRLEHCAIGDAGAASLGRALACNDSLTALALGGNEIGAAGAAALCAGLERNSCLRRLALTHNAIDDAGATSIASALHANSTLRSLELRFNRMGAAGGRALARALTLNRGLARLCVLDNPIDYTHSQHATDVNALMKEISESMQACSNDLLVCLGLPGINSDDFAVEHDEGALVAASTSLSSTLLNFNSAALPHLPLDSTLQSSPSSAPDMSKTQSRPSTAAPVPAVSETIIQRYRIAGKRVQLARQTEYRVLANQAAWKRRHEWVALRQRRHALFEHQTQSNQLIASPSHQAPALQLSGTHTLHAVQLSPTAVPFMSSARTIVPIKPVIPRMFAPSPDLMSSALDKAATPAAELSTRSLHSSTGQSMPPQSVSPALTPSSLAAAIPISVSVTPLVATVPETAAAPAIATSTPSKMSSRTVAATPVPQVAEVTVNQPIDIAPAVSRTITPALAPVDEAIVPKPESPLSMPAAAISNETAESSTPAVSSTPVVDTAEVTSQPLVQPEADDTAITPSTVTDENSLRPESRLQTPVPSVRHSARQQPVASELTMTDVPQDQSTVTDVGHKAIDSEAPVALQSAIEMDQSHISAAADSQEPHFSAAADSQMSMSATHSARSVSIQPENGDGSSASQRSLASISSVSASAASVPVQSVPVEVVKPVPLPPTPEPIPLAVVCRCDSFDTPLEVSGAANLADGRLVVETPVFMRVCYTCTVARVLDNWPSDLFQQIVRFV